MLNQLDELYRDVIQEGLCRATKSVKIGTANVKNLFVETRRGFDSILKVFEQLIFDGVSVEVLHAGVPSESFLEQIKDGPLLTSPRFHMRRCPRIHFKMVLMDYQLLYLGSANLTGAGIGAKGQHRRNFENGILTNDMDMIDRVYEQFDRIWRGVECGPCQRKDHCPVPLEDIKNLV